MEYQSTIFMDFVDMDASVTGYINICAQGMGKASFHMHCKSQQQLPRRNYLLRFQSVLCQYAGFPHSLTAIYIRSIHPDMPLDMDAPATDDNPERPPCSLLPMHRYRQAFMMG